MSKMQTTYLPLNLAALESIAACGSSEIRTGEEKALFFFFSFTAFLKVSRAEA